VYSFLKHKIKLHLLSNFVLINNTLIYKISMSKKKKKKLSNIFGISIVSILSLCSVAFLFLYSSANNITPIKQNKNNIQTQSSSIKYKWNIATQIVKFIDKGKEEYTQTYNFEDDASLQRYIDKSHPLNNIQYVPIDLEPINLEYIINKSSRPYLRWPARKAFESLAKDFYNQFNKKLYLVSAYRSYQDQQRLINKWCSTSQCATPGTSEHQLWLAMDLHVELWKGERQSMTQNSKYYQRLDNNAHKYGFHNTYKRSQHVDEGIKIKVESRHRRYLPQHLAQDLYEADKTLWEYFYENK